MARRDKRGRLIGRNWWREYNFDLWFWADHAWRLAREDVCSGHRTEEEEYAERFPRPTFKTFLIHNAGMNSEPE